MRYEINGKWVNIPDQEIEKSMKILELTKEEAIEMWLEDEGYLDNEEQDELTQKVKESGIMSTIHGAKAENDKKKPQKPRTVKISDEKQELFANILENLKENYENVEIVTQNKLITVKIGEKSFKIDVIEQRKPKTSKSSVKITENDILEMENAQLEMALQRK